MADDRDRRTAMLGILIGAVGLLCLGGGVALLFWRLAQPERSVILPPGAEMEATPTPGLLGSPLPPPALPANDTAVVILPVDEHPTGHPTAAPTEKPSTIATASDTSHPTHWSTVTPTRRAAPSPTPTITPVPSLTATLIPTATPSPTDAEPETPPDIPDRIVIESIGLSAPVLPVGQHPLQIENQVYSQWDVPNLYAAGWHQSSAPLGKAGNTVINGHHNAYGEVFRYLVTMQPGETFVLEAKGRRYTYEIAQTMVLPEEYEPLEVRRENARWILPTEDERVTLITCWPYSSSTHRLIVIALPVTSPERPSNMP